jgi:leucyl/phenylalanyl-tRNA--protein transferase
MIPWLDQDTPFPDVETALEQPAGLLAAGADLSLPRLLDAYLHGIFPWFSEGQPILWWSTDPRMVLKTDDFIISHSLKKTLRKVEKSRHTDGDWEIKFDSAFEAVMRACAAPRHYEKSTWISEEIIAAYCRLHKAGFAHSAEAWFQGELVGGAYGVAIGTMYYGESMFARKTDASKIALSYLVDFLRSHGVPLIDCQQETAHLASLGARPIARKTFIDHLRQHTQVPSIQHWHPLNRAPGDTSPIEDCQAATHIL